MHYCRQMQPPDQMGRVSNNHPPFLYLINPFTGIALEDRYFFMIVSGWREEDCPNFMIVGGKEEEEVTKMEVENMVALVSRTGRDLQRYNFYGQRQVVGCIPYRYKVSCDSSSVLVNEEELEVLVITSQRQGKGMLFPKGGWETDESIENAALRETVEEAGVVGQLELKLGKWNFKSKRNGTCYEGHMFPLLVEQQLEFWPEKDSRERIWVSVREARNVCQYWWMKEALELLVNRLAKHGEGSFGIARKSTN